MIPNDNKQKKAKENEIFEFKPCSFFKTATSILRTCFDVLADSSLRATISCVTVSCP